MLASVLMDIDLAKAGETGLILFLLIFLCVTVWTFTRSRRDVHDWADIPLENDSESKKQNRL